MNAADIKAKFPHRDRLGFVIGYYLYAAGQRKDGPFPTIDAAERAKSKVFPQQIVCGHVFDGDGKLVRALGPLTGEQTGDLRSAAAEHREDQP